MDREKIIKLAKSLYFVPSEKVIETVLQEKDQMLERINFLHTFDTKDVPSLEKINSFPKGIEILFDDEPNFSDFISQLFTNSVHADQNEIITKKVIDD
ncbi:glutamyl-tRNA amidotransferase [Mesomycoplasma ovipneumoniae]|uniref:glutamyl-tRNA amidotransferase n=1 Tax=Mesomycoplasma ovipneumoniae TaxID=29562 RepID=UPI0028B1483C|nr:glutamyl-tRNA amidotransferase [Mesomycoplasma ovipneumoniae]WNM16540.1 glutamyl-tRNA amidotransferase [Mesomycoplasma ovipneumoniae]